MRSSRQTSILNTDDFGSTFFRGGRKKILYFEDLEENYYVGIVELILKNKLKDVEIHPPIISKEFIDGEWKDIEDKDRKGKDGVLELHKEALISKRDNLFFVVDSDYDSFLEKFEDDEINSKYLHILDVYSIENFHVNRTIAESKIRSRMNYYDNKRYDDVSCILCYDKWKENVYNCFKELLPYLLAGHCYFANKTQNDCDLDMKTVRIDIHEFFEFDKEKVRIKIDLRGKYWKMLTENTKFKFLYKKFTIDISKMDQEDVLSLVPGKLLLNIFIHYLFDISCLLHGQDECGENCLACPNNSSCVKLNYKGNTRKFRCDSFEEVSHHPKFNNFSKFILGIVN